MGSSGRGDEDPRPPSGPQRGDVPAREVDAVGARELLPRQGAVVAGRAQLLAQEGDGPLAVLVDVGERAALRSGRVLRVDGDAERLELLAGAAAELVVGERREQEARAAEVRELDGRDGSAARRLLPRLEGLHDLPGRGHVVDARELDPLDVPDDRDVHDLTS